MRIRDLSVALVHALVGNASTPELAPHPASFKRPRAPRWRTRRSQSSLG
jgi:hypothetical protein